MEIKTKKWRLSVISLIVIFFACQTALIVKSIVEKAQKKQIDNTTAWLVISPWILVAVLITLASAAASGIR